MYNLTKTDWEVFWEEFLSKTYEKYGGKWLEKKDIYWNIEESGKIISLVLYYDSIEYSIVMNKFIDRKQYLKDFTNIYYKIISKRFSKDFEQDREKLMNKIIDKVGDTLKQYDII